MSRLIDVIATLGAFGFAVMARAARRRAIAGPPDSIWSTARPAAA